MWWQQPSALLPATPTVCSTAQGNQQLTACHHSSSNRRQCALCVSTRPNVHQAPHRMSARFKSVGLYASHVQQKPWEKLQAGVRAAESWDATTLLGQPAL